MQLSFFCLIIGPKDPRKVKMRCTEEEKKCPKQTRLSHTRGAASHALVGVRPGAKAPSTPPHKTTKMNNKTKILKCGIQITNALRESDDLFFMLQKNRLISMCLPWRTGYHEDRML